ncbi:MAG: hypothetical protein QNJ41_11355 [Xenococcaceae cyanobacterium MO_188.B32]|nr:hypothetical protein [Xenococcaceae cyanobacterium MO_188.B32]
MATDYILFIHGVNTRDQRENPRYADDLIEGIKSKSPERKNWDFSDILLEIPGVKRFD